MRASEDERIQIAAEAMRDDRIKALRKIAKHLHRRYAGRHVEAAKVVLKCAIGESLGSRRLTKIVLLTAVELVDTLLPDESAFGDDGGAE